MRTWPSVDVMFVIITIHDLKRSLVTELRMRRKLQYNFSRQNRSRKTTESC